MLRKSLSFCALVCLLLGNAPFAWADGPHWQVPDPGPVSNGNEKKEPPKAPPPPAQAGGKGATDYTPHVPDILQLNDECVKWYEKHCVIKFSDKKQFYLEIMARSAQAMREVDTYLPCPDSFPLWHTEELRELMVGYAQDTWVKCCTELGKEFAEPCMQFCLAAFLDTVRFRNDGELTKKNKALQDKLNELDKKGNLKGGQGFKDFIKDTAVHKVPLDTFKHITGDIPLVVDGAQERMFDSLVRIGRALNPLLEEAAKKEKNAQVAEALKMLYNQINKKK